MFLRLGWGVTGQCLGNVHLVLYRYGFTLAGFKKDTFHYKYLDLKVAALVKSHKLFKAAPVSSVPFARKSPANEVREYSHCLPEPHLRLPTVWW